MEAVQTGRGLDAAADGALSTIGRLALLALAIARALRHPGRWGGRALEEMRRQGVGSLPLVFLLNALGGAVTSQQTGYQFEGSLPLWVIGSVVAASVITELAPVLTGLALVGMVGARITAELGAMTVSQQVDALEMIGRDPVEYLVVPRVVAGVVTAPLLVALALPVGMAAGWAAAILLTPVTSAEFVHGVRFYMRDFPMFFALIKAAAFGLAITFTASYVGLRARGGSMGVGRATTTGVVAMLTAILFLDALLAPLLKVIRL
jgi:phospholipid/cholesterol/gamma-HCH transport system permease protein